MATKTATRPRTSAHGNTAAAHSAPLPASLQALQGHVLDMPLSAIQAITFGEQAARLAPRGRKAGASAGAPRAAINAFSLDARLNMVGRLLMIGMVAHLRSLLNEAGLTTADLMGHAGPVAPAKVRAPWGSKTGRKRRGKAKAASKAE
jgi:hypothetical protein